MENLMSHSDYEDAIDLPSVSDAEFRIKSRNHRSFLKQSLELWMFVPCDEEGNVLKHVEKPLSPSTDDVWDKWSEYRYTKERCLFDGLRIEKDTYKQTKRTFYFIGDKRVAHFLEFHSGETDLGFDLKYDYKTIEDLTKLNFTLTPTAIKQLDYER